MWLNILQVNSLQASNNGNNYWGKNFAGSAFFDKLCKGTSSGLKHSYPFMARIFTINFYYDNNNYNAVVSVRNTPFYVEYTLTNFNEELLQKLPGNKIISKEQGHYTFQNATPEHSEALMKSIIKVVSEHMHAKQL